MTITIYTTLTPAICINILNFLLFPDLPGYHQCFLLFEMNNPEYVLTDNLIIHFLEVPKFEKNEKTFDNKLEKWLYFFKNEGIEDDTMKILIKEDKDFKQAHNAYMKFSQDEMLRDAYEARRKAQLDYNTGKHDGIIEGIEKGIKKGKKDGIKEGERKKTIETVKKMLSMDYSIDNICAVTGLSRKEVEDLKE